MELPPGPRYVLRGLLQALPASIAAYCILRVLAGFSGVFIPTWLSLAVLLVAPRAVNFVMDYWRAYQMRVDVAAHGAVLVPQVSESGAAASNALVDSMLSGYPGDVYIPWREQKGETFTIKLIEEDRVVTFEPEHIKSILATNFENFKKGSTLFSQFRDFLGTGVFNSDDDMWRFHRSMTRPFFSKERITDFDVFDRHAHDAIGKMVERLAAGYPINFQDMISRFTLDSASEFLFGKDVCTLSAGLCYPESSPLAQLPAFINHPSNRVAEAFMAGQSLTALRTRYGPTWPMKEFWRDKIKPHRKKLSDFIQPILTEALAKHAATLNERDTKAAQEDSDDQTLISYLVHHTQDSQIVLDELVNLLVAGRDTTASTLTFSMYMLTQHPDIVRRLREEILNTVGHGRPTFEQIKEMKYLRAFINEILRLYPPVPTNSRTAEKATLWAPHKPGDPPFYIPRNTKVIYSVFWMHRRTDLWGPDAEVFDPDRFIDERLHKYLVPNPFIFLPFNAGPRICLGQQFAYHEVSFFLVRLLQRFVAFSLALDAQPQGTLPPAEWSKRSGTQGTDKIWPASHLTLYVKGGLWVRMEEEKSFS